jgi:hypothetical protein
LVLAAPTAWAEEKPAEKTGTVVGKVTYRGKPLPGGTITFVTAKGKALSGRLDTEGAYEVKNIPVGEVRVLVTTVPVKPTPKDAKQPAKYVQIPKKYADPKTTPLRVQVKQGEQTANIQLTD